MIDVHKASIRVPGRLLATRGFTQAQRAGTPSPNPWHFALWASSMVHEQGDAATMPASPMPLDCCGARGACQQSPILHSSSCRVPPSPISSKGLSEPISHAIGLKRQMPGVWGQSPQLNG